MSKFAALALSHALRKEGWEDGVRATALCPGLVATDMGESVGNMAPEQMTQPEDLARLVSMALNLPNTASLAELNVNASLDDYY
jgi:short-subunit dehydrogenase